MSFRYTHRYTTYNYSIYVIVPIHYYKLWMNVLLYIIKTWYEEVYLFNAYNLHMLF